MMCLLIIFYVTRLKDSSSAIGVISKFAHCCCFKISWIEPKFVMGSYLIQCILVTHMFISCEV
jgi:hypothetical protein